MLGSSSNALASTEGTQKDALLAHITSLTDGQVVIEYHEETGLVRYIGAPQGLRSSKALHQEINTKQAASQFIKEYGLLFGLEQPFTELSLIKESSSDNGHMFFRYQQTYQEIPVLGGELIVSVDMDNSVTGAIGETLAEIRLDPHPKIKPEQALITAFESVIKGYGLARDQLAASDPELWIYNPALLGGPGPRLDSLVWKLEVTTLDIHPLRELVLVDAQNGHIHLQFNQADTLQQVDTIQYADATQQNDTIQQVDIIQRMVYDLESIPGNFLPGKLVRPEGSPASGIIDADRAYDFAGDAYDYFYKNYGRNSIDNHGMPVIASVRYCPSSGCDWMNAFWNGQQMVFTPGVSRADDVVAHELVHGITQYEANLFYYMQSGAINEAISDIFGEFIDLTNGRGTDTEGVRWLMGEDLPGGAIRSLKNPTLFGHPDRMTSPNYYCGTEDNGGVHRNSGVANKAAYLMADGGYFNGYLINGIGIQKTSAVWYETLTNLLTSGAGYNDLYNGLQHACSILSGTGSLGRGEPALLYTGAHLLFIPQVLNRYSPDSITTADCEQVKKALDAVEMYRQPPSCAAVQVSTCPAGYQTEDLFFDNMEFTTSGNWTTAAFSGQNTWFYPQNPNSYGFDATYSTSGIVNIWGYNQPEQADYYISMTKDILLPTERTPYLHFNHAYAFEGWGFDGGVIEFKRGGDTNWYDAGLYFPAQNGYRGRILKGFGNPLADRQAFIGYSSGYTSTRLDLSHERGSAVRFRFRIGTDNSLGALGWFIDDFRIYTCAPISLPITPTPDQSPTPTETETPTPVGVETSDPYQTQQPDS
jgi:bacillolysin